MEVEPSIPYEDTLMFKVYTDEIDSFFLDQTLNIKYKRSKTKPGDKGKTDAFDSDGNKIVAIKKLKRTADTEIMENIDETCLFGQTRSTRNATKVPIPVEETKNEPSIENKTDETNVCETMEVDDKVCESKEDLQTESKTVNNDNTEETKLETSKTESADLDNSKSESTNQESDKSESLNLPSNSERSLFDILADEAKSSAISTDTKVAEEPEKTSTESTNLFGNLMKTLKIPESLKTSKEMKADHLPLTDVTTPSKSVNQSDQDGKSKDIAERNLFDFIKPESVPIAPIPPPAPVTIGIVPKPEPSVRTRSQAKQAAPFMKQKKPMFKFPKLASPFNFGNIAKLGMAKIKEESKDAGSLNVSTSNGTSDDSVVNVEKTSEILPDNTETTSVKVEDLIEDNIKEAMPEKNDDSGSIVMETFEELRKRLARERAAIKLQKEKTGDVDDTKKQDIEMEELTLEKNDACEKSTPSNEIEEVDTKKIEEKTASVTEEVDYEMFKDFTPQKIVLILDISKKHGVEFASTSFGLPVPVIVNWIIEKDRKHRKVSMSVSLEEKLRALERVKETDLSTVAKELGYRESEIEQWNGEIGWMIKNKGVCDVLKKWKTVESVVSMNFDDKNKGLEKSGVDKNKGVEKVAPIENEGIEKLVDNDNKGTDKTDGEINTEKYDVPNEKMSESVDKKKDAAVEAGTVNEGNDGNDKLDVDVSQSENVSDDHSTKATNEGVKSTETSMKIPGILDFVCNSTAREFTMEQKAILVLLTDKYGIYPVSKKTGVNHGTLFTWKRQNSAVRSFLNKQRWPSRKKADVITESQESSKSDIVSTTSLRHKAQNVGLKSSGEVENLDKTATIVKNAGDNADDSDDDGEQKKGYRIISPSKLPLVLKNISGTACKDFSLEQKVAIVKLVELYGVRTIHKQFRIPAGSIWNWQHSKAVKCQLFTTSDKTDDQNEQSDSNKDEKSNIEEPFTIDSVLDRSLIVSDSVNHLNFQVDQKADIVCLIEHFGVDYVCEKIPQIPRGTLWNWRHNRNVLAIVDKLNARLRCRKEEGDTVITESVNKNDLTQKWLKDLQDTTLGRKRKNDGSDDIIDGKNKFRKNTQGFESPLLIGNRGTPKSKAKIGPKCSKRNRRSNSPSTMSTELSIHSNDIEEVGSDVDLESVTSKKSTASSKAPHVVISPLKSDIFDDLNNQETTLEVMKTEIKENNLMMICYHSNSASGQKRPSSSDTPLGPPAKKKNVKTGDPVGDNWIPLDEYYYGTHDGDAGYTEEKGEYRFKCWYCSKMLYNNVRAMQHIQGHIDASKQQNIDLSDLTQCKHCYKQFDTPFEMQTHVEKVHLSNKVLMCHICEKDFPSQGDLVSHMYINILQVHLSNKVLMCRICEKDFPSQGDLVSHMKTQHRVCEMPYVCQLCQFRSSMYSDVVDHFKKKHDSSNHLLCLYCLRAFEVKFVSQGWGQTQTYYGHLLKHQTKSATKKCGLCRLMFFNSIDVKTHRKTCHNSNPMNIQGYSPGGKSDLGTSQKKGSSLKSLNAPSVSRIQDYGEISFPASTKHLNCVECKMLMSSTDHYKKYIHCTMCRFATSCSVAYANHMMGFHSGQMSSLNLNIPWERPIKNMMYCACGFSSKYGNKIANHLVQCGKWTSFWKKPVTVAGVSTIKKKLDENKDEGSLLDMLGLVQKKTVVPTLNIPGEIHNLSKKKAENVEDVKKQDTKSVGDEKDTISDTKENKSDKDDAGTSIVDDLTKEPAITDDQHVDKSNDESKDSTDDKDNMATDEVVDNVDDKTTTDDDKYIPDDGEKSEDTPGSSNKDEDLTNTAENKVRQKESTDVEEKGETETEVKSKEFDDVLEESMGEEKKMDQIKGDKVSEDNDTDKESENTEEKAGGVEDGEEKDDDIEDEMKELDDNEKLDDGEAKVSKEEKITEIFDETSNDNAGDDDVMDTDDGNKEDVSKDDKTTTESDVDIDNGGSKMDDMDETGEASTEDSMNLTSDTLETVDEADDDSKDVGEDIADEKDEETVKDTTDDKIEEKKSEQKSTAEDTSKTTALDVDERSTTGDADDTVKDQTKQDTTSKSTESNTSRSSTDHRHGNQDNRSSSQGMSSSYRSESASRSHGSSRDRSHDSNRDRSHDSRDRSHERDRSYDRDRNRDRDRGDWNRDRNRDHNRQHDHRSGGGSGYGHQDNRDRGYRGGHQGHRDGYRGNRDHQNRGGHHQDRNFNRNYNNRGGGYNQNYRGGYRGGYY